MEIRSYCVALIVSPQGMNDRQHRWVQFWLGYIAKSLPPECKVKVMIPGFNQEAGSHYGIPRDVWNKVLPAGCEMQEFPGWKGQSRPAQLQAMMTMLQPADEIWCLPTNRQTHYFSTSLPTMMFHHGLKSEQPPRFKWVPPWIETEAPPTKTPKGRGVKK